MSYLTETLLEYPDNYSIAAIVYFSGCDRNCTGCHNTTLHDYKPLPDTYLEDIIQYCARLHTNKLVLCGGDPLFKFNLPVTKNILEKLGSKYDICIYTGADIEEVKSLGLSGFTFIKCGYFDPNQYIGSEKTDDYIRFATKNQELYDSNLNLLSKDGVYYYDARRNEKAS